MGSKKESGRPEISLLEFEESGNVKLFYDELLTERQLRQRTRKR
jgi:hypothetical protein